MAISKPKLEERLSRAWDRVSQATGLTADHSSSIAYNIIAAFCAEIMDLWDELEVAESQSNLSTATGVNLDTIGEFFGVTRRSASSATTVGTTATAKFTNNGADPVTIPAETRVWPTNAIDRAFFTVGNIVIPAGQQGYTDLRAASTGTYFNVGANTLTNHSLGYSSVTVTNELPITNGRDTETDENFRVRIAREILRKEGANLTAVREALLEVPGVRDVVLLNLARGTGTLDALIYGYDRTVPDAVVAECQRVLDEEVAAGVSAIAKAPVTRSVDVTVRLRLRPSATFAQVRAVVSEAIRGYIDNLPIEAGEGMGVLVFQELAARVQEASGDIIDSEVSLTVDNIPALRSNQTPSIGERFVSRAINIS